MIKRRIGACLLSLALLFVAVPCAFAWGPNAERLVTSKAVDTLPPEIGTFFDSNRRFLVQHVTDSAATSNSDPAARGNGFIALDHYGGFPFAGLPRSYTAAVRKYGRRTVDKYGLLPWQVGVYSQKLTQALESRDWQAAKLAAAALAHYVAAAHDPFDTTTNGDGSLSNQPGVNQRFGGGLVDRYQLFFFVKPNEAIYIKDPTDHAFEMVLSAHAWLENILNADRLAHQDLAGYSDEYYDRFYAQAGAILVRQLSDASTDVGSYWMTAWINAGRPKLPSK
ncbi:MAG: hypothetical protein KGL02_04895 [Acidobacteriota bacterium]|nr:hypothetical protein [Acidobacteriota bacterium]MDE3169902.1 hypothetical protein [Acidobacteriota bacterium]